MFKIYPKERLPILLICLLEYYIACWSFNGLEPGGPELRMRMKEGKRLMFPGLHSRLSRSRESTRNREREREREKERETDTGTKALMEQRCFNQHGVGLIYYLTR